MALDEFLVRVDAPQLQQPKTIPFLNKSHLWIEMSTTDEEDMRALSNLVIKKNASVLEAPITGGQHRAESGNISILVAGSKKTFSRAFPILSCLGHQILHCGKIGNASTLKVVTKNKKCEKN